ncbi:EamA family transporter, partial [bacterium]
MKRLPELVLILVTIIWGGTFLATRTALQGMGPFTLLFVRFAIGAVLVGAFVRRRPSAREAMGALIVSVVIMVAFAAQTVGLQTIGSARAAFLTAFYVPLVPLLQGPLTGRRPSRGAVVGAMLAFLGLT